MVFLGNFATVPKEVDPGYLPLQAQLDLIFELAKEKSIDELLIEISRLIDFTFKGSIVPAEKEFYDNYMRKNFKNIKANILKILRHLALDKNTLDADRYKLIETIKIIKKIRYTPANSKNKTLGNYNYANRVVNTQAVSCL